MLDRWGCWDVVQAGFGVVLSSGSVRFSHCDGFAWRNRSELRADRCQRRGIASFPTHGPATDNAYVNPSRGSPWRASVVGYGRHQVAIRRGCLADVKGPWAVGPPFWGGRVEGRDGSTTLRYMDVE